jgi:hypothetical protein
MTRSGGRRPGRSSRSSAHQASPPKPPPPRGWTRLTKIILGAGALAAAITAVLTLVLSLLPSPDPQDIARFISVRALSQVPLNEFHQRSAVFKSESAKHVSKQGSSLVVAALGQTSAPSTQNSAPSTAPPSSPTTTASASETATPTGTATPSATTSPTSTTSPIGTATPSPTSTPTSAASPSGGIRFLLPPGLSFGAAATYAHQVADLIGDKGFPFIPLPVLAPVATDEKGDLVSPEVAAKRLIGVLGHTRAVSETPRDQHEGSGQKREPLGELISVNMELMGLRGQPVFLSWSIFRVGGHNNLFGRWLSDFVAYRIEGTTDDDTGTLPMWIPLPKGPGPYFIRLTLTTSGAGLASKDSDPFG